MNPVKWEASETPLSNHGAVRGEAVSFCLGKPLNDKKTVIHKMKDINPAGFNFHCPEKRSYVIFDPQSQEENDRLDVLLGASKLWERSIAKKVNALRKTETTTIQPFTELIPVAFIAASDEFVAVVLAGAIAKYDAGIQHTGQWFAVRVREDAVAELKEDLRTELEQRKQALVEESAGLNFQIGDMNEREGQQ
jgi:hypothetical protein